MLNSFVKRSWVEVNLEKIKKNYIVYKNAMPDIREIMAVVKADAYGHGAVKVAVELQKEGVENFAVSNVEEAVQLRNAGIRGQILVLGYTPIDEIDRVFRFDITQAIVSKEYANALIENGTAVKCQVAIDTGMNRIGINSENIQECEYVIRRCHAYLSLTGIFTHCCVADSNDAESIDFTSEQISRFHFVCDLVKDLDVKWVHYCNSAAGIWHNHYGNLVRLGIILYGLKPNKENILPAGVEPALEWKSVVSMTKKVYPGETIGYGRTFKVEAEMKVATIPTGYADGYSRDLSNRGFVLIRGKKAPILGRVCMDQFMVDVTDVSDIKMGDEVVLIGRSGESIITADDMAEIIGTIEYEVVCNISKRVPRVYV